MYLFCLAWAGTRLALPAAGGPPRPQPVGKGGASMNAQLSGGAWGLEQGLLPGSDAGWPRAGV